MIFFGMLNLLREFRKDQIKRVAIRKYLLYAAGEILLVMIGILLALQVNNWNELKQQQRMERTMVNNLYE